MPGPPATTGRERTDGRTEPPRPAASPGAILDGRRCSRTTATTSTSARAAGDYGRLGRLVDEAGARLRTARR